MDVNICLRAVASVNGVIWCLVYFQCTHPHITSHIGGVDSVLCRARGQCLWVNYGLIVKARVFFTNCTTKNTTSSSCATEFSLQLKEFLPLLWYIFRQERDINDRDIFKKEDSRMDKIIHYWYKYSY